MALLEGLEAVELLKSEVLVDNGTFRFDSEYFKKRYILIEEKIKCIKTKSLKKLSIFMKKGLFDMPPTNYKKTGIPFIRVSNCHDIFFTKNNLVFLNEEIHNENSKFELNKYDMVMSKIGTFGEVSINLDYEKINYSQNNIGIKIHKKMINPFYLTVYLNSFYSRMQIEKVSQGQVQAKIILEDIQKIKVPICSETFQLEIEKLVKEVHQKLDQSQTLYQEAEALLLEEVGLTNFQPSQEGINIKSFSESFGTTGRLDAEYYQPKYEDYIGKITSQNHQFLYEIVTIKKSIEPGSKNYDDEGLPFIRVSDFSKNGITSPNKKLKNDFVKENKKQLDKLKPKKGTILFSKDGTVGIAYHLREDYNGITSGAILHLGLKTDEVLPEYLTLVLNSDLVQKQAERDAGGSIIQHWREEEIKSVVVPIIAKPIQEKIAEKIEQSFALKTESERLLEVAKQAVELAIEKSEAEALEVINKEINNEI